MHISFFRALCGALLGALMAGTTLASDPAILPLAERAALVNRWLDLRLTEVLPTIMRREKFDMWIVICREYNEDPVYLTLVPEPAMAARRLTMLVFFDRGEEGLEKLAVRRGGIRPHYEAAWDPEENDQWARLAAVVAERDPQRIGINRSEAFAFGDGLSASLEKRLIAALEPRHVDRLHSAERLALGWLEHRHPAELEVYPQIVRIAHELIAEAFSDRVITPGVTTREDVVWWMREKISGHGLGTWFQPSVSIQRSREQDSDSERSSVIRRGDLLHCDIGITYLRLNTDTQEHAYVLREGETDAPAGLRAALSRGNRLQDILTAEFRAGRTGNEILLASLERMKAEGINGSIYSHPLGFHGHGAGPTIGLWDQQRAIPGRGDYPLFSSTAYAIELSVKENIPEWNGQEVRIGLEQDAVFLEQGGAYFLDGRQTEFHLVR